MPARIADRNAVAPHSVPGFRSPHLYRAAVLGPRSSGRLVSPNCLADSGSPHAEYFAGGLHA